MSTLILVTSDTGAGCFKLEKRSDRVQWFTHRLVTGPVAVGGPPETFFEQRKTLYEGEGLFYETHWFDAEDADCKVPRVRRIWRRLPQICLDYDRIELWIDPDPNAQLLMVQLLDWLGAHSEIIHRLWIKHADSPLGQRHAGDWVLPPRRVEAADLALASRAWSAFGASTPEAWSALRYDPDIERSPGLRQAIERTLAELPDADGLGTTARVILTLAERQDWWSEAERRGSDVSNHVLPEDQRTVRSLIERVTKARIRVPLWYFEIGELICELGTASMPALSGVPEVHFASDLHRDPERRKRMYESPVGLTEFGRDLLAGKADWILHNPVHRWLGGTRLTLDTLWRWDRSAGQLIAPFVRTS